MRVHIKYLFFCFAALCQACIDPISFETESSEKQIVFFGNFTQLCENHLFNITQTSDLGEPPAPVSNASVVIIDDEGNSVAYEEIERGKYQLTPDQMLGIPGKSYHIEIQLSDGKSYFSRPQVMPEPIEVDDMYFQIDRRPELSGSGILVDKTFIDVFIDTPLQNSSGESSDLRWAVEEVYSFVDRSCGPLDPSLACYFIDPIDDPEVLLFKNEGADQDFLSRFRVRSRLLVPYDEFTARHYFIVQQYTTSEEESNYWEKIDAVANQSGSLFDIQPAGVPGNIIEEGIEGSSVLGYFGVNGASLARVFTTPFDIRPNPVFDCNDDLFFRDHLPECCNCFTKSGIRIERPEYWDEG